jgi:plasmid stability protein
MATVTVKNIPDELYARLKHSAVLNRRSINREAIVCLEQALQGRATTPETVLAQAQQLRKATRKHPLTDAAFSKAKAAGRR